MDYSEVVHAPYKVVDWYFAKAGMNIKDFVTISSVRNPWARTVSLYHYQKGLAGGLPFDQWLQVELPRWRSGLLNRWNTYEMFHDQHGVFQLDRVVRLEYLAEDLKPFVEDRWPDFEIDFQIKVNQTNHRHYATYYTPELAALVADHFRYDIETWNYTFGE